MDRLIGAAEKKRRECASDAAVVASSARNNSVWTRGMERAAVDLERADKAEEISQEVFVYMDRQLSSARSRVSRLEVDLSKSKMLTC
jgi:hypothetical protein